MKTDWIKRAEWIAAIVLSLAVIGLIGVRAAHVGALWRDECGTNQLSLMPSILDVFKNFEHQTLPPLFDLVVRFYCKLVGTDIAAFQAFRILGGITLIAVAWLNSRLFNDDVPLFVLSLFGLNLGFLFWSNYAVVAVPIVWVVGLTADLLFKPTRSRTILFALVSLLSAQLLINNLVLVIVIGLTAIVVCLVQRSHQLAIIFAGVVLICAASDLAYLKIFADSDWPILLKASLSFRSLWDHITAALGAPSIMPWVWYFILPAGVALALWRLRVAWRGKDGPQSRVLLFAALTAFIAPAAYCLSFRLAGYQTIQSRHFVPMLAVLAANSDIIVARLSWISLVRLVRIGIALIALVVTPITAWSVLEQRQTNIDIVAQKLEQVADPDDLIVVNPWSLGISFNWYYRGHTRWLTVPNISDHRMHRFDLIKQKMMMAFPLADLEQEISATLRSGHRVWVIGNLKQASAGRRPLFPLPAPDPEFGWQQLVYRDAWSQQLSEFIANRAGSVKMALRPMAHVSALENVPLWVVGGGRD